MASYRKRRALQLSRPVHFEEGFTILTMSDSYNEQEREERRILARLMIDADAFVDVGAHHGFYSVLADHMGTPALALEPEESTRALLQENARGRSIEVVGTAVGAAQGTLSFYGEGEVASLSPDWEASAAYFERKVPVTTLDALLENRFPGARLLIKVDVEGAEDQVIAGASKTLTRPGTRWMIEMVATSLAGHPVETLDAVFDAMNANGYEARFIINDAPASAELIRTMGTIEIRNVLFERSGDWQ